LTCCGIVDPKVGSASNRSSPRSRSSSSGGRGLFGFFVIRFRGWKGMKKPVACPGTASAPVGTPPVAKRSVLRGIAARTTRGGHACRR